MTHSHRHKSITAAYLILKKDGKLLLLRRSNTGYCDGLFGLPSGHVDEGEPVIDAMVREAKEEIDIKVHPDNLKLIHVRDRKALDGHRIDFFFECEKWEGDPVNVEPHKCSELSWVENGESHPDLIPYIKETINLASKGDIYSLEEWKQ